MGPVARYAWSGAWWPYSLAFSAGFLAGLLLWGLLP